MREIEIEFKNLLSEEQYLTLFKKYDLKNSEEIINKNFYYDDADENFKKSVQLLEYVILTRKPR